MATATTVASLEMNEALVDRWNETVRPSDTIWLLGDFAFSAKDADLPALFARLHGHKCLVVGNHDDRNPKVLKLGWERVERLLAVKALGMRAVACHFPLETWEGAARGYIHVHGHSHGTLKRKLPRRWDVGVDVQPRPVSLDALWEMGQAQEFIAADHYGDL